ncbi:hypothetical protein KJ657_04775 [Patescibacteria group bacterium]|nr:hypothetical protein [Patescibacteria group bacterium]MBU1016368.1 hypothetical protein [Patescibacteria group bacterium]MBU1685444.1 hypothetical protein [Patescibacteria group bacterium]
MGRAQIVKLLKIPANLAVMPTPTELGEIARKILEKSKKLTPARVKANFDMLLEELLAIEYICFQEYEKVVNSHKVMTLLGNGALNAKKVQSKFNDLYGLFLSMTQSRKARAGISFESHVTFLFEKLNYPHDAQPIVNGKPDFILPSKAVYLKQPLSCIVFTVKRTLRERWKQVTTEATKGYKFYLGTIDTGISENQIREAAKFKIFIVVPERIKFENPVYASNYNVISFREFFEDHVEPELKKWKKF